MRTALFSNFHEKILSKLNEPVLIANDELAMSEAKEFSD